MQLIETSEVNRWQGSADCQCSLEVLIVVGGCMCSSFSTMVKTWLFNLSLLLVVLCEKPKDEPVRYCYAEDNEPYIFLGTKTAYNFVGNENSKEINIPGCIASKFWLMSRHGTRYPSEKDYGQLKELPHFRDQVLQNHKEMRGQMCAQDLQNLKRWSLDVTDEEITTLTDKGKWELAQIANRYQKRFPTVLMKNFSEDLFVFRHTNEERTSSSAYAFAKGLFQDAPFVIPPGNVRDLVIKSHNNCTKWIEGIEQNPEAFSEAKKFEEGEIMQSLIRNVTKRLGFDENLKYIKILAMFDMCRYNKAWDSTALSPWCAVFSKEELKVMEYMEDIINYYESGYGHNVNLELGCSPIKDFIQHFRNKEENAPNGFFYFSHSTTLRTLLSRLEFAKDNIRLLHNNYEALRDRKWRTSFIGPFSTNLALVYFKCPKSESKVMFFFQEHLVNYDGCSKGICTFSHLEEKFSDAVNNCDLAKYCTSTTKVSPPYHIISHSITAVAITVTLHYFGTRYESLYSKITQLYHGQK